MEIPDWVVGYHGTNRDAAARIVEGEFLASTQSYDWLGHGFYLWQDSPWRAHEWATDRYSDQLVLAVRVSLERCLDLLDPRWQTVLADADAAFVAECLATDVDVPANRPSGNRARDCATINWYCELTAQVGNPVRSVRAVFEEGEPIFEASAIHTRSHVQIAVRDPAAIVDVEELPW